MQFKKLDAYPDNKDNAYDASGKLHNEICEAYLMADYTTDSLAEIIAKVELVSARNSNFISMKPIAYQPPTANQISLILNSADPKATAIIANSEMSTKAKLRLETFMNSPSILAGQYADYEVLYQFIIDYEDTIITDSLLTVTDKRLILTTTSIARHAYYFASKKKKRPRDRDWDINWTGIIAGTEGAGESMAKAITMSVVTAINQNN